MFHILHSNLSRESSFHPEQRTGRTTNTLTVHSRACKWSILSILKTSGYVAVVLHHRFHVDNLLEDYWFLLHQNGGSYLVHHRNSNLVVMNRSLDFDKLMTRRFMVNSGIDGRFINSNLVINRGIDGRFMNSNLVMNRGIDGGLVNSNLVVNRGIDGGLVNSNLAIDSGIDGRFMNSNLVLFSGINSGLMNSNFMLNGSEASRLTKHNFIMNISLVVNRLGHSNFVVNRSVYCRLTYSDPLVNSSHNWFVVNSSHNWFVVNSSHNWFVVDSSHNWFVAYSSYNWFMVINFTMSSIGYSWLMVNSYLVGYNRLGVHYSSHRWSPHKHLVVMMALDVHQVIVQVAGVGIAPNLDKHGHKNATEGLHGVGIKS